MQGLLEVGLTNAVVAAAFGLFVALFGRVVRRPALVHALWLVVLLKLVTPPGVRVPLPTFAPAQVAGEPMPDSAIKLPEPVEPANGHLPQTDPALLSEVAVPEAPENDAFVPPTVPQQGGRPPSPLRVRIDWTFVVAAAWIAGSVLALLLVVVRVARFRRMLRFSRPAPAGLEQEAARWAARLGLRRCPRVGLMPGSVSPLVWGVGRGTRLLLPEALLGRLSDEGRAALVLHELAHVRRRDHWVRWFEVLVTLVYWWHPVVWLCRRELREAEERCCDAWVVWALPEGRRDYARALVQTIEFLSEARAPVPAIATGIGRAHTLKRRLTMIMQGKTKRSLGLAGLLSIVFIAGLTLPLLPTWGQSDKDETENGVVQQASPAKPSPPLPSRRTARPHPPESAEFGPPPPAAVPPSAPPPPGGPAPGRARPLPVVDYLPQPSPMERKIMDELGKPTTLKFEEQSLEDIFEYLQDLHQIRIFVDRKELENLGIFASEEKVTMNLEGIPLQTGLRLLLDGLELDYIVRDQVLKITSQRKAQETLLTRIYLVGDLWTEPDDPKELIDAIKITFSPDSWDPIGLGTIFPISKSKTLLIRQSYRVHEEILQFLQNLRSVKYTTSMGKRHPAEPLDGRARAPAGAAIEPVGQVVYVSNRLGEVWIDRGSDDGISKGQRFGVYSHVINGAKGEKKAEIEVTAIRQPHLSEARIVQQNAAANVPILEGDLLFPSDSAAEIAPPVEAAGTIDLGEKGMPSAVSRQLSKPTPRASAWVIAES